MSSLSISYKYGITGFVELQGDKVKKYSEFNIFYWLKEHAILLYLWPFRTDNIVKYLSGRITNTNHPEEKNIKTYYVCNLERYPTTLLERKLYRDREIIQFLLDMTSALAFLHSKGITHRDLKPSNIAISSSGRYILIDFSHAHKMYTQLDRIDAAVVTYYYRAPEIFEYNKSRQVPYNNSIDIWALGTVLVELITCLNFAEYYTSGILDHDDAEIIYSAFLQDPKVSYNKIKEYYFSRGRPFIHTNKYFEWITKMISHEPERRITAEELYKSVVLFADENKIPYCKPINGPLLCNMPNLEIVDTSKIDATLKQQCMEYLLHLKNNINLYLDIRKISSVINFLIAKGEITEDNYKTVTGAIAIILESTVFDGVGDFDAYGELETQDVKNSIIHLIRNYDQHLFGQNGIFTYN